MAGQGIQLRLYHQFSHTFIRWGRVLKSPGSLGWMVIALIGVATLPLVCSDGFTHQYINPSTPLFHGGLAPVTTGLESDPTQLSAQSCLPCHENVHSQWKGSIHAKSWDDPVFKHGFESEPKMWCVNCHAPLVTQHEIFKRLTEGKRLSANVTGEGDDLLHEGINCVTCHVREGKMVDMERIRSPAFCGECHQFNFPLFHHGEASYSSEPMQNTYQEYLNSGVGTTCQSCHFGGSHELYGPHHSQFMSDLLREFEYQIEDSGLLRMSFALKPRGHRLPTGDLFHSLVVQVARDAQFAEIIGQKRYGRFYTKGLSEEGAMWDRKLARDTTIPPTQSELSLTFDVGVTGGVYLRVLFNLHDTYLGGATKLSDAEKHRVLFSQQLR